MEMSQKIWWHELSTWDAKTAIAFYEYTLGWKFWPTTLPDGESYWIASKDGQPVGSIFELSNPQHEGIPAHWMTYMQVPDILEAQSAAATAGGEIMRPATEIPGVGKLLLVSDVSGAMIGMIEPENQAMSFH